MPCALILHFTTSERQYLSRGMVSVITDRIPNPSSRLTAAPRRFLRPVKPKQGRSGTGKRRIKSRTLRLFRGRKYALDFTEEGIVRKDNFFEVVFNPGSDKREKRILCPSCKVG